MAAADMDNPKITLKRRSLLALAPAGAIAATAPVSLITEGTQHDTDLSQDALPPLDLGTFLSEAEQHTVGAVFDRLIPADDLSIGATQAGCVTFVDKQLAGDWGKAASRYRSGPFRPGTPEQGDQSPFTPRERYRRGLKALDERCNADHGKAFADLPANQQDDVLRAMEAGKHGDEPKALFALMLQNVREGYFADPLYGGNKDMAGWKLIGFPGARYDYRLEIDRPGEDLKLDSISLLDKA
jgi:gluconate 2-dehydrogenase gamma chain